MHILLLFPPIWWIFLLYYEDWSWLPAGPFIDIAWHCWGFALTVQLIFFSQLHWGLLQWCNQFFFTTPLVGCSDSATNIFFHNSVRGCSNSAIYFFLQLHQGLLQWYNLFFFHDWQWFALTVQLIFFFDSGGGSMDQSITYISIGVTLFGEVCSTYSILNASWESIKFWIWMVVGSIPLINLILTIG